MKDLTEKGNEAKLIFNFTIPLLIGNVFQQLYTVTDSIIVGKVLGKQALAAIGSSFPIIFLLVALSIGLTMGCSVLISQYFGAKDIKRTKRAIDSTYVILIISSIVVTILGTVFSEETLNLINTPGKSCLRPGHSL